MSNTRWIVRFALGVSAAIGIGLNTDSVKAQCANCGSGGAVDSFGALYGGGVSPLFNNYFTVGASDRATAGMYISPTYVPGWVGNTYNTYQPLYPHEFLYTHKDSYHNYYDCGAGLNRTKAVYYNPPVRTAAHWIHKTIELPR